MANPALNCHSGKKSQISGITEIHITQTHGIDDFNRDVVLPMLAHLSRQATVRWFTWIAPKGITKELLLRYGFNLDRVQLIHPSSTADMRWLIWEALNSGTSETVVVETNKLSAADVKEFEVASINGACRALLLHG